MKMTDDLAFVSTCRFDTKRLRIEPWGSMVSDTDKKARLTSEIKTLLTPSVLKFLPEQLQPTNEPQAVEDWIITRDNESDVFCIRERDTNTFLGLLILAAFPDTADRIILRIGYFLVEDAWGKGIATELVTGLVKWGKEQRCPMELLGGVEKANSASGAVLVKAGFEIATVQTTDDTETYRLLL